jgi:3-oxosteroid 1-dehydrogenase
VEEHNKNAETGVDTEFGRGESTFNKALGDATLGLKNPNLGPIKNGPFIALRIVPGTLGTAAGLKTDAQARVLREDGSAVEGLYACGNDATSIMAGIYPGAGITIGPAIVSAFLAVEHATGKLKK